MKKDAARGVGGQPRGKGQDHCGDRKSSRSDCEITKSYARSSWGRGLGTRSTALRK